MKADVIKIGAALLLLASSAQSQGLLSIGQRTDYKENIPLTVNVTSGVGYDHTTYGGPGSDATNVDSGFLQGGVGLSHASSNHVTKTVLGVDFSTIHYLDDQQNGQQTYYNARVTFDLEHAFSRKFAVKNNFYFAYEIEPNYSIGATSGRRAGQYAYGYDNFSVSYAWSERFASTTGYTLTGIHYKDRDQADLEDRWSQIVSEQISYKLNRNTTLAAEYRFEFTNYTKNKGGKGVANPDYHAHYLLAGVDQAWSPKLSSSVRAGAEIYESDRTSQTSPYLEASLNYGLSRTSSLRWYNQLGYDGSDLGDYNARYTFHTGIIASQKITEKLTGSAGIHYVHSDYKGGNATPSSTDNEINATVGMNYKLWKNLSVDANYSYTTIASDITSREYDRHYTTLGLNASF